MITPQLILPLDDELIVDLFAGGGGASSGIEAALGRHVDVAINHDRDAVSLHEANHPQTRHYCSDVFEVDPRAATGGRPVGLLHASPDCTHHSQARGGQPRSRAIRSLSWVVHRWAGAVRPRVITLENVEQILQWSPLVAKRCPKTGRALRLDGSAAPAGERTPIDQQFLVPDTRRKGHNWHHFVAGLRRMGYDVQWRTLCAADYGAPTTRSRLFLVARCDGEPIVWPEPTHHRKPARGQRRWRAAAECIDWSLPTPSIFERQRPLAEATLRRIARGIRKYVLDSAQPFIVPITHNAGGDRVHGADEPLRTITTATRGEFAAVAPTLVHAGHGEGHGTTHRRSYRTNDPSGPLGTVVASGGGHALAAGVLVQAGYGEREGQAPRSLDVERPLGTVVAGGIKHAVASAVLVGVGGRAGQTEPRPVDQAHYTTTGKADAGVAVAYLAQANDGPRSSVGHPPTRPLSTIATRGCQQQLVAASLATLRQHADGADATAPLPTITAGGEHHAVINAYLEPHGTDLRSASSAQDRHLLGGRGGANLAACASDQMGLDALDRAEAGGDAIGGVPRAQDRPERAAVPAQRPSGDLVGASRSDTAGAGDQSQGRVEDQQSPRQPGADDGQRQYASRVPHGSQGADSVLSGAHPAGVHRTSQGAEGQGDELFADCRGTGDFADDSIQGRALRIAAFLLRYYGEGGQDGAVDAPAATITTKDRLALVTVTFRGTPYVIVDIGLRMLQPRELYRAQGFPASYVIDRRADGTPLPKSAQVRMCGNSVSPPPMTAIVRANYRGEQLQARAA